MGSTVRLQMSVSVDGFTTGPDDGMEHGLGVDGERLHDWLAPGDADPEAYRPADAAGATMSGELMATVAVITGRRTFEQAEGRARAAQACLHAGLLDKLEVHVIPELLGHGGRLFEDLPPEHVELELVRELEGPGVLHLRSRVRKAD